MYYKKVLPIQMHFIWVVLGFERVRKKMLKPDKGKRGGEQGNTELIERLGRSSFTQSGSLFTGVFQNIRGFIKKKKKPCGYI